MRLRVVPKKHEEDDEDTQALLDRTRAILEGIADGVYVTDPAGRIRLWNRAAERLTGFTANRAKGQTCSAVLGLTIDDKPLDCSSGCALLAMYGAQAADGIEVCRLRRDLRKQPMLVTVSAVKARTGDPAEFVHTVRDMTSIRQADEAKTMFLATASHELKTPLTVIIGFTEMLRAGMLTDDQSEQALRSIDHRARELSKIVDRLLLTGRIEAGRMRLELKPVQLDDILHERADALATATDRKITVTLDEHLPAVVGDDGAIATVLDHLLDNAIKYSPDGGAIELHARGRGTGVEVTVIDHGIGMDEEQAAHCFDRFWQAESSDVRRFGGTGIGLYIVRALVEAMGGRIRVTSGISTGTTFTVSMQRARPGVLDAAESQQQKEQEQGRRSMIEEFMRQIGIPQGGEMR